MNQIAALVRPIQEDLLSGAAEIALRAITIFQAVLTLDTTTDVDSLRANLIECAHALLKAQPAMAPVFHLCNQVLSTAEKAKSADALRIDCQKTLTDYEKKLCDDVAKIADYVLDVIPPGELIFAYSFSSTVVSCLLSARARGRYFRVACTESMPSMEGRKLASQLAEGKIEVMYTYDSAMGLVLPNCSVAFMGCDCVGAPGLVNKAGSLLLALACKDMGIPLYCLASTDKFVSEDRLFEFENHERPGSEVWSDAPAEVKVLNRQFELIPVDYISGIITEKGMIRANQVEEQIAQYRVHEALALSSAAF
jgi:translation initiation factor 2B subunit (eIF-2B alpha/beta/delta family)